VPVVLIEPAYLLIVYKEDAEAMVGDPAFPQKGSGSSLQETAVYAAVLAMVMNREVNGHRPSGCGLRM
jgi:hypothetical protein